MRPSCCAGFAVKAKLLDSVSVQLRAQTLHQARGALRSTDPCHTTRADAQQFAWSQQRDHRCGYTQKQPPVSEKTPHSIDASIDTIQAHRNLLDLQRELLTL